MNNIFLKSAKKSLLWKTLNVLVVFSLVSSYTVPLIPVVRAEDTAEVSVSDSPAESTPDTSTESGDESQSDEDRGNTGTDELITRM